MKKSAEFALHKKDQHLKTYSRGKRLRKQECFLTALEKESEKRFKNLRNAKEEITDENDNHENKTVQKDDDGISSEVEILDYAKMCKEGNLGAFVPSMFEDATLSS